MTRLILSFRMTKTIVKFTVSLFLILSTAGMSPGQKLKGQTPVRERLLNELSVLLWKDASAEKVFVSLRVHSGSAFDLEGKDGTAKLLTEVLFPDTGIFEDFKDELGGSLSVVSNFDYIQVDMVADPDKLVPVLEILASAFTSPQIDKESTQAAKKRRLEQLNSESSDPKFIASDETAARLFGDFPYGRSQKGNEESIEEIDFADLIFFKERFLTADNATLAISGNIDTRYAYLAARRLLGSWQKGNGKVPSNFTLPEAPDTAPLIVNIDSASWITESYAVESAGRKSPEHAAAKILARILNSRLSGIESTELSYHFYLLRGYFVLSRSLPKITGENGSGPVSPAGNPLRNLLSQPVGEEEFRAAFSAELDSFRNGNRISQWLDIDTYGQKSVEDEFSKLEKVKLKDVAAFAAKVRGNPIVEVNVVPLEAASPANVNDSEDPNDPN